MAKISELANEEPCTGSTSCAGCGAILAVRLALKALGEKTVVLAPAGCLLTVVGFYPQLPLRRPFLPAAFPATASMASGVARGLKIRGDLETKVVAFAGDGGTVDIGMQALSGMFHRNDNVLFICYDNEAYMNTGIQYSAATPPGARTTTTPAGGSKAGIAQRTPQKKDMLAIAVAHGVAYAANACVSYWSDYIDKVRRAASVAGASYVHVLSPCPTGWGYSPESTIEMGRLAVETGLWPLTEACEGKMRLTVIPRRRVGVAEYFRRQSRFRSLTEQEIQSVQESVDARWRRLTGMEGSP